MTKLTSTILGLTLVAAFSVSEAVAAPPVLVHNGAPVSYAPTYGTAGHSARSYGNYGTRVRSPYSYGHNNRSRYPLSRPHGYGTTNYGTTNYGTTNYGTLGYGYPASRGYTPGHGGLNVGLSYGSY